jgi:3-deoxy-D-manno-octulosonate 8-phosphate phosphatase (KDO 8-P phosphatase)
MNVLEYFQQVTAFVFDVDGVMTDGSVLLLDNGLQARTMNVKDGLALQMAIRNGYKVIIVSGGNSEPLINRFKYLGIEDVHLGLKDKLQFLEDNMERYQLSWRQVLYMGDDLPDIPLLEKVGLSCCPEDAVAEVKKVSKYISIKKGGQGCVREVIEKVLKLNDNWNFNIEITSR